ncbi:hypothetical protein JKP88DRAFT_289684 [Tribonema minus]|uniref:Uncharacterized protein n=1 Tax=Tribonema minus TaxID=303371 RepID=A0A835Z352_9STRA|nr:hypothetical protein JKP88DRAFT_289684 [Tribonema minus]
MMEQESRLSGISGISVISGVSSASSWASPDAPGAAAAAAVAAAHEQLRLLADVMRDHVSVCDRRLRLGKCARGAKKPR